MGRILNLRANINKRNGQTTISIPKNKMVKALKKATKSNPKNLVLKLRYEGFEIK